MEMIEKLRRLRRLRVAWAHRKAAADAKVAVAANEIAHDDLQIETISEKLRNSEMQHWQFHDLAIRNLITKTRQKDKLVKVLETLHVERRQVLQNLKRCERLEEKQKLLCNQSNAAASLVAVIETLLLAEKH
jgi:hypothetical protein